jgi:predicted phosphodiesterase
VVRGNVDTGVWSRKLPLTNVLELAGVSIYVLHFLDELDLKPEAAGLAAVIYGHSHKPQSEMKNGVLYFNPRSAGPRRFELPVTIGKLKVEKGQITAEVVDLQTSKYPPYSQKARMEAPSSLFFFL